MNKALTFLKSSVVRPAKLIGRRTGPMGEAGMTIVELGISMGIAMVLATVVLAINLGFLGNISQSQVTAELAVESHFVLQTIIEDIRLADGIAATGTLADANAPGGGWATSDTNNILIINSPAIDADRNIIYDPDTGFPYRNEFIYFMSGNILYKRVIKNPDAPDNSAVTTCPPAASSASCPTDKQYTTYMNGMEFVFYDASNAVTTDVSAARSVKMTLAMNRRAFGQTISFNNSIQTTLRN